jgi:ribonuclease G
MSEEILVNVTPQEIRVASIENGVLQEVAIERTRRQGFVGNVYMGTVSRVLPGMGAAFLEIGLERTAFLHVSDIVGKHGHSADAPDVPEIGIETLLHDGQRLLVQVVKDPLGTKGARLTTRICVPSRYVVFTPGQNTIGISQRIENDVERTRLRDLIVAAEPTLSTETETETESDIQVFVDPKAFIEQKHGGYIVRTAAEGVDESALCKDMAFVKKLWSSIRKRLAEEPGCQVVYEDLPLVLRTLRDLSDGRVEKVRIDSIETQKLVVEFADQFLPKLNNSIELYSGERPIFDLYGVEDEIQKALLRKVPLKSGGHLVLDQTEAMTTIDVNTGGFVGSRNLEETIFKTNLEAAQSIARHLRLRNLGGIVIIDFIDMTDTEHQRQVLRAVEKSLEHDHAKTTISEITSLGLVQITRKRTRESLEHVLCEPCPLCDSRGSIKTAETVCYELLREILRGSRQFDAQRLLVVASQEVVDRMHDEESTSIAELEEFIGRPIRFQVETLYSAEQYDVVPM